MHKSTAESGQRIEAGVHRNGFERVVGGVKKQFCVVYAIIIYEVIERTFAVLVEILREVGAVGAEDHGKLRRRKRGLR